MSCHWLAAWSWLLVRAGLSSQKSSLRSSQRWSCPTLTVSSKKCHVTACTGSVESTEVGRQNRFRDCFVSSTCSQSFPLLTTWPQLMQSNLQKRHRVWWRSSSTQHKNTPKPFFSVLCDTHLHNIKESIYKILSTNKMNKESEWGWVHSGLWSAAARLDASFKCFSRKFMFIWGHSVRKQAKFISGWDIQRDSELSVREMKIKDGGSRKSWPHPRGISEKKKKGDVRTCESVISSPNWTSSRDTALWLWQISTMTMLAVH